MSGRDTGGHNTGGQRPASLEQIQRWMQSVVMYPGEVAEGLATDAARRHLDIGPAELESVIARSAALDSASRLQIYVDAYYERLLECLREEYAATAAATGHELFDALAFGYLQQYPSQSYTLNQLGAQLPGYLAQTRLHEQAMPAGADPSWADFIIELARFERVLRDVFDGPGTERCEPLSAADLAEMGPETWGSLRFVTAPCLRLGCFSHRVHEAWSLLKQGDVPVIAPPAATYLAISRRDYRVEHQELAPAEFSLLESLIAGNTLSEAIAIAAEGSEHQERPLEQRLQTWFATWMTGRFFVGLASAGREG